MSKSEQILADSPKFKEIDAVNDKNQVLVQRLNNQTSDLGQTKPLLEQIMGHAIDDSTEIRLPFYTDYGRHIMIGKNVFINSGVMLTDLGGIVIEDGVLIGPGASILSVNHPQAPSKRRGLELSPVYLHKNVWIGAKAIVLPGNSVGENAIVAAGAVVTHNVPDNAIVAGVPARVVKMVVND